MKKYCKNDWILVLLLFVVILMVYYPALNNDFIMEWDDQWQVMTSTTENGLTWENINHMFSYSFQNQYFPVNQLCYSLVYLFVDGYKAWGFHLFCVLLHLSNTLLVFILFKRLLRISGRMDKESIRPVSFITALLFAIHPLNVESVAWISASKILVYSFFYLIALYTYLIYIKIQKKQYLFLTMFLFVVSFGGKEQAVIFPVCLLLMDWFTGVEMNKLNTWFEKIPFFLIALLLGCVTLYVSSGKISLSDGEYVLWERLLFGCYSYVEYLLKWFVPVRLLYLYPFPSLPGEPVPDWLLWYPLLMVVVGWVFKRIFKFWPIYFGLLFFSINLLMTLHLIPMPRMAIVADRYIYISSIGLTFITGYYFMALYKKWKQYRFYLVIMFFVALFYLGTYANMRVRVWHDSNSLKQETQELIYSR